MSTAPIPGSIDHIVLGAPDLAQACAEFEATTGVRPALGGAHPGLGTHNALVSFDETSYLEIIAPDPAQRSSGTMARSLAGLTRPTPLHWAIRVSGLADVATRLRAFGWTPTAIRRSTRTPPNAAPLQWDLCGLTGHRYGGVVPFFIDWLDSAHPTAGSPRVGALLQLQLTASEPTQLQTLIQALGVGARITDGPLSMSFRFASPRGEVSFSGVAPRGFTLGD